MRFPGEVADVRDIPSDWEPPPIGTNAEVRRTILQAIPELQLEPDGHGRYEGPGFSLNVNLSGDDDEDCDGLTLRFYGSGPAAAGLAVEITEALGARAISTGGGGFLDRQTAEEAWTWWQSYRDHVVSSPPPADPRGEA